MTHPLFSPEQFTDTDLRELTDSGAVQVVDLPQRSFSEAWRDIQQRGPSRTPKRMFDPRHQAKLREMRDFLVAFKNGQISEHHMREVMSTSDFPILFGDILDTRLLAQYRETPVTWPAYAQRGTVVDFRQARLIALDGMQQPLYPSNRKAELDGVDIDNDLSETPYTTQVQVYERGYTYNWRMLINRRGEFLSRLPQFLARAARRTEEYFATDLFVNSTGPDSTFFSAGHNNIVTGNPALGESGLEAAVNLLYGRTDSNGQPIVVEGITLLVPPLLTIAATKLLRAVSIEAVPASASAGVRILTENWMQRFKPVTNWYLPIVDTSANKNTTWYLFADPQDRPAMEMTFLQGYEEPSMWQKAPNTQRLGGGVDPMMGDYEDMSIHQKIMHILGGTLIDYNMVVVSDGSGS